MNIPMQNVAIDGNGDGTIRIDGRTAVTDETGLTVANAQIIVPRATFDEHGAVVHLNREQRRRRNKNGDAALRERKRYEAELF